MILHVVYPHLSFLQRKVVAITLMVFNDSRDPPQSFGSIPVPESQISRVCFLDNYEGWLPAPMR